LVLLATIYVAIVVPYNAAFHAPVICHETVGSDVHVVGGSSIVNIHATRMHSDMGIFQEFTKVHFALGDAA
jgi:hypothetical protein